jgi:hypothetical protein
LFPYAWSLLAAGIAQAEASGDARVLHEALTKLVNLQFRSDLQVDANGIQISSGADYSTLVSSTVYAAAGHRMELIRRCFSADRPLSKTGSPVNKAAANLLVFLVNPQWKHAEKGLAQARRFVESKASIADRAFVGYFLAMATKEDDDGPKALDEFAALYLKSDWGRYAAFTKPLFLHGLVSLARAFRPGMVTASARDALLGEKWTGLFNRCEEFMLAHPATEAAFTGELAFLNVS